MKSTVSENDISRLVSQLSDTQMELAALQRQLDSERTRWERPATRWRKMRKSVHGLVGDAKLSLIGDPYERGYHAGVTAALEAIDRTAGEGLEEGRAKPS